MKKLIIKGILLFLLTLVVLFAYDRFCIHYEDAETIRFFNDMRMVSKADIVLFGDSHCQLVKKGSDNKNKYADLSLTANDVFVSRNILNQIEKDLKPNTIILMNVSYMSLHYKMMTDNDTLKDNFNTHLLYYSIPMKNVNKKNAIPFLENRFFAINHIENIGRLFASLKNKATHHKDDSEEKDPKNPDDTTKQINEKWFVSKYQSHTRWMKDTKKLFPDIKNLSENALCDIVKIAESKGCKVIFYSTPHHITFSEKYSNPNSDTLSQEITDFMAKNKFTYLDHFKDTKYIYYRKYFYNGDHLNLRGTKLFMADLVGELKNKYNVEVKY